MGICGQPINDEKKPPLAHICEQGRWSGGGRTNEPTPDLCLLARGVGMVVVEKAIPVNRIMLVNINKVKRKKKTYLGLETCISSPVLLLPLPSPSHMSLSLVVVVYGKVWWLLVVVVVVVVGHSHGGVVVGGGASGCCCWYCQMTCIYKYKYII